jgi:hypothetical protein
MPSNSMTVLRAEERAAIVKIADMIAKTARANASWSSTIPPSTSISAVKEYADGLSINVEVDLSPGHAPSARAFERGSGIHATRGERGYILIKPKYAPALVFPGTNAWKGMTVIVPPMGGGVVHHPGVAPRPFLAPAVAYNQTLALDVLKQHIRNAARIIIRQSWVKV